MSFISTGLVFKVLELLGVEVTSITGSYLVFLVTGAVFAVLSVALLVLIFKLIVFIRKG